ncbi:MAG: type II secretion system F family protein [Firmicutes bacterium]|nr:type II secretion system F family protein [Bacillota bacterium]
MEYYEYKSINKANGKTISGIVTADDISSAEENLKKRGENIIEIGPMRDFMNIKKIIYLMLSRCSKKVKLEFLSMLKFMLSSGMSLHEALTNIRDSSTEKAIKKLAERAADEVRQGADLSTALKKTGQFDNASVQQINAGEESGTVDETLTRLIQQYEREIGLKSKIKSASIYPVIICVVMVIVLWVMMTVIVPTLVKTLVSMGGELPLITKIVIGTSSFMKVSTPYFILLIIIAFFAYKRAVKIESIRLNVDRLKLKIPIIGNVLKKLELSRFCRNLSAMQRSGITLVGSLNTVSCAIKNTEISKAVEKASRLIEISGMNLSNALSKSGKFPMLMLQMIEIGVESGQICEVLDRVAEQYENEVDTGLKRILSIIEPLMIVIVGLLVGVVVISIFLPLFSMTESI